MKLLGNLNKGLVFVVSAPAGTGKTTLVKMLVKEFPCVIQSISYTTRPKRYNESSGDHYHFVTTKAFEKKIRENEFLEYVKLYDDYYGTSRKWVAEKQALGFHVVLVIDTQGALQLVDTFNAQFIFIAPPSLEELKTRLIKRNTDSAEAIVKRLAWAKVEMEASHYYDYKIVNDSLDVAYQTLRSIVIAEEHRVRDL